MINPLYKTPFERLSELWNTISEDSTKQAYDLRNTPYLTRQFHHDLERKGHFYIHAKRRFDEKVALFDVLNDNYLRFTVFGFLERLFVLRQTSAFTSYPSVRGPDGVFSGFNKLGAQSLARGAFRGNLLSTLQFLGVHYQALSLSNKNLGSFCVNYVILDALFHPLDTIKTRYQADTRGVYKSLADCAAKTSPSQLFSGLLFRLGFSSAMAAYFTSISSSCYLSPMSVLTLFIAYPFLTLKSISQVTSSPNFNITGDVSQLNKFLGGDSTAKQVKNLYRGFLPFLALNMLAPYVFPQLWTTSKQEAIHEKHEELKRELGAISSGVY